MVTAAVHLELTGMEDRKKASPEKLCVSGFRSDSFRSPSGFAAVPPPVPGFRWLLYLMNPAVDAASGVPSAALAGLDDHVGELLHFRRPSRVVEDGQGFQVCRDAAGRGRRARVQRVVQTQELFKEKANKR